MALDGAFWADSYIWLDTTISSFNEFNSQMADGHHTDKSTMNSRGIGMAGKL